MTNEAISSAWGRPGDESASFEAASTESRRRVHRLSHSIGAIRTIAAGRLILATYWLLAFLLDPPATLQYGPLTYGLLYTYSAYALVRAVLVSHTPYASRPWQIALHVVDLCVFAVLTMLTEGATSPFFLGFVFALVCATLLFDMPGMHWTAASALLMYV